MGSVVARRQETTQRAPTQPPRRSGATRRHRNLILRASEARLGTLSRPLVHSPPKLSRGERRRKVLFLFSESQVGRFNCQRTSERASEKLSRAPILRVRPCWDPTFHPSSFSSWGTFTPPTPASRPWK